MPQLEVDGATLTYDDEGPRDGEGVPLVFVHGWTANRHRWDHQTAHFSERRRVVRLDLRGHGESTGAGVRRIDDLAADVLALLDHLKIERFVIVGHSMGGMIAQTVALSHPERVERMVLVNSIGKMAYSRGRALLMAASTLVPFKLFDLIAANRVGVPGSGFESDDNALVVYGRDGFERALGPAPKIELADNLLELIAARLARG